MWAYPSTSYRSTVPTTVAAGQIGGGGPPGDPNQPPSSHDMYAGLPDVPNAFPEFEQMSLANLQALAGDSARFENYIANHKHTRYATPSIVPFRLFKVSWRFARGS